MGLLLFPSGQLIAVALANADISDASVPAHFSERRFACIKPGTNLLCGQPLVLFARRAAVLSNGVLDEVLDALEFVVSHWRGSRSR